MSLAIVVNEIGSFSLHSTFAVPFDSDAVFKRKTGLFDEIRPACNEISTLGFLRDNNEKASMLAARINADGCADSVKVTYCDYYKENRHVVDITVPNFGVYRSIGQRVYVKKFG